MKYITTIGEREFIVEIIDESHIIVDNKTFELNFDYIEDQPVYSLLVDGYSHEAYVYLVEGIGGAVRAFIVMVEDGAKRLRLDGADCHHEAIPSQSAMPGWL
jgi:hypothetical protein